MIGDFATVHTVRFTDPVARILLPAMVFGVASFTISMFTAPYAIKWLRRMKAGTMVRRDYPPAHHIKVGTPLMGGVIFSGVTCALTVLYNLYNHYSQLLTVGALISCSVLGVVDDLLTTIRVGSAGL